MRTPAGDLRHKIIIRRPYTATTPGVQRNALGEIEPGQHHVVSTRAKIMPVSAREIINAASAEMTITHKVTIRYKAQVATLTSGTTIEHQRRIFHVSSIIDPENAHEELIMLCTEQMQ